MREAPDTAAHQEDYEFLVGAGVTDLDELARRVGVTRATIVKYRQRGEAPA